MSWFLHHLLITFLPLSRTIEKQGQDFSKPIGFLYRFPDFKFGAV